MKWELNEPKPGDMIRVKFADALYHYGIFVSDDEVIQFGLAPTRRMQIPDSEIEVMASDIDSFLGGGFLEVGVLDKKESKTARSPKDAISYARSKMGTRGYNILYNNCEHFANECLLGMKFSSQADAIRAQLRALPIADIYFAEIPEEGEISELCPPERNAEICATSCERVKKEKYYAWKLLEYAVQRSFGLKIGNMNIVKLPSGKWRGEGCEFSISHSDGAVAVAVSRAPVGVDIEAIRAPRCNGFAEKILSEDELIAFDSVPVSEKEGYLIDKWTAKEASFKAAGDTSFIPSRVAVDERHTKTARITIGGKLYSYSIVTTTPERLRVYESVAL